MAVLTLSAAKTHLNISVATYDAELTEFAAAAEAAIAERCGPLELAAQTVRVTPSGRSLVLPTGPADSLTSVTDADGVALTIGDLYLDKRPAIVTRNDGALFASRYYTVVYQAGRTSVPNDLLMGVKELVRHMWQTQRGPTRRPGSTPSDALANTIPGSAYVFPFRVTQLIAPHVRAMVA